MIQKTGRYKIQFQIATFEKSCRLCKQSVNRIINFRFYDFGTRKIIATFGNFDLPHIILAKIDAAKFAQGY